MASPLDGLRVLDIGTMLFPAPLCAAMLSDLEEVQVLEDLLRSHAHVYARLDGGPRLEPETTGSSSRSS